jgi:hypothetical protein
MYDDFTRRSKENELIRRVNRLERRHDDLTIPEISSDLISPLLALPMLRGAWACSVDSNGDWYDLSGLGKALSQNGDPTFNYDGLVGYWDLDGTGDYFSRADEADLDILGSESYVAAAARGMTTGGWFWFDNTGRDEYLLSKYTGVGNRTFYVNKLPATDFLKFVIYDAADGADNVNSASAVSAEAWYHVVVRFDPSTEIAIFLNGIKNTKVAGIPAALQNSGGSFEVGAIAGAAGYLLDGRAAYCFLCAAACSDMQISSVLQQQRGAFGV